MRERLGQATPEDLETRDAFLARLRRTVNWLNERRWEDGLKLCTNQKERADDVKLLEGAKTKWVAERVRRRRSCKQREWPSQI